MSSLPSPQGRPQAVWVFPPPRKPQGGKLAFIVLLAIIAVAIVAAFLYYFVGVGQPQPAPSPSASISPAPTDSDVPTPAPTDPATSPVPSDPHSPDASPAPSDSPEPAPSEVPSTEPEPSTPPVDQAALQSFIGQVQPQLDDARTGLDLAEQNTGTDAASIVDTLIQDAGRLSEAAPPPSHADAWGPSVSDYAVALQELKRVYEASESAEWPLANARAAVEQLRALLGI